VIAVIGLGHAGLVLAAAIADSNQTVIGIDIDKKRCDMINNRENPLPEEPGLGDIIYKHGGSKLYATTNYKKTNKCNTYIILVPLFLDKDHKPDFSILRKVFSNLAKVIKNNDLIILETTVPIGTTEKLAKILDKSGKEYLLAFSPERIMTGYSLSKFKEYPKIVGGRDYESTDRAYKIYSRFCNKVIIVKNIKTAEMVKLSEGIYRDINIALANELYKICDKEKINYWEVKESVNCDLFHLHEPGSVGGPCIPYYPWFLINNFQDTPLIRTAREVNDNMVDYYISQLGKAKKIGVIGLSFRADIKELTYSRSIELIKRLLDKGYNVYAKDPMFSPVEIASLVPGLKHLKHKDFNNMDVIIIMNKVTLYNKQLKDFKHKIIDVKNIYNGNNN